MKEHTEKTDKPLPGKALSPGIRVSLDDNGFSPGVAAVHKKQ